jgi:hypothetical protein
METPVIKRENNETERNDHRRKQIHFLICVTHSPILQTAKKGSVVQMDPEMRRRVLPT